MKKIGEYNLTKNLNEKDAYAVITIIRIMLLVFKYAQSVITGTLIASIIVIAIFPFIGSTMTDFPEIMWLFSIGVVMQLVAYIIVRVTNGFLNIVYSKFQDS